MTSSKHAQICSSIKNPAFLSNSNKKKESKLSCFGIESTRLSAPLEDLNTSHAQSAGELWPLGKMAKITLCRTLFFTQILIFEPEFWL